MIFTKKNVFSWNKYWLEQYYTKINTKKEKKNLILNWGYSIKSTCIVVSWWKWQSIKLEVNFDTFRWANKTIQEDANRNFLKRSYRWSIFSVINVVCKENAKWVKKEFIAIFSIKTYILNSTLISCDSNHEISFKYINAHIFITKINYTIR